MPKLALSLRNNPAAIQIAAKGLHDSVHACKGRSLGRQAMDTLDQWGILPGRAADPGRSRLGGGDTRMIRIPLARGAELRPHGSPSAPCTM